MGRKNMNLSNVHPSAQRPKKLTFLVNSIRRELKKLTFLDNPIRTELKKLTFLGNPIRREIKRLLFAQTHRQIKKKAPLKKR